VIGHRMTCGTVMSLCADYAKRSEELAAAAESFRMFGSAAGEPSSELQKHIGELLDRLGVGGQATVH
jgi:hypothetical protein